MNIETKQVNDITIVELTGKLDSNSASDVQDEVMSLIKPNGNIILHMENVSYMSSAGLRMLLLLNRSISSQNGQVVLVGVSQRLQDVMAMTGFLKFFNYHDTLDEGLAAFDTE